MIKNFISLSLEIIGSYMWVFAVISDIIAFIFPYGHRYFYT